MLIDINSAARRLGISTTAAKKVLRNIPPVVINRQMLYPVETVMALAVSDKLLALKGGSNTA